MSRKRARISALGCHVPDRVVKNADLEKMVDTTDEWIHSRTGIRERRRAEPGTPTSEIALNASRKALDLAEMRASDIDLIIVATITPDVPFPATACILQDKLGASRAWCFDVSAACSGFIYALTIGAQFIETGAHRKILVVGADVMSAIVDYEERSTCILFGDGAGAVLLEPAEDETGILDFYHETDGWGAPYLNMPAGGSALSTSHETVDQKLHFIRQDGRQIFKYATRKMAEAPQILLARHGLTAADIDLYVAHQANARIIDAAAQRLGVSPEKVVKNIERYGNTTGATIPLALGTALDEGALEKGDLMVLTSVGAGLTVGAMLVRWSGVPWK
ncbi:MAG: ketoacyl-ACP synthase III [Vicinamibacteria bacterium]|nr:ketoacyl-ACP synthase III [Vicinamibacteria bacterium]